MIICIVITYTVIPLSTKVKYTKVHSFSPDSHLLSTLEVYKQQKSESKLQKLHKVEQTPENNLKLHLHQLNYQASTPSNKLQLHYSPSPCNTTTSYFATSFSSSNKLLLSSSKLLLYLNWTSFVIRYKESPRENPS